jgi:hypothetical protein
MVAVMGLGHLVFGWGGLLDVKPADLVASLTVDCGEPGAGPPEEITVRYEWSWTRSAPLPNEVDTVFLGWDGKDAEGRQLYVYSSDVDPDPTIRSGQRGELGVALLEEARGTTAGFQWAVDLIRRDYDPGRIAISFRLARPAEPGTYTFAVRGSYIHLGQWRVDAQPITCTW